jgi:hypothetical protein
MQGSARTMAGELEDSDGAEVKSGWEKGCEMLRTGETRKSHSSKDLARCFGPFPK